LSTSKTISNVPALIAIFTASMLCLSVIYDFGYFKYIGFSFSEAPTSVADHIRSSLVWLPTTVIGFFFIFVFELINRRVEQGMTEEELIESSPVPKFTKWFRESPKYLFILMAMSIPISWAFGVDHVLQAWLFSAVILWFVLHSWLFDHWRIIDRTSGEFFSISRWLPAIAMFVAIQGAISAEHVISSKEKIYIFSTHSENIEAILLRTFDGYFLVWHPEIKKHEFISKSSVKRFYVKQKI
jgi:hypothetical protein